MPSIATYVEHARTLPGTRKPVASPAPPVQLSLNRYAGATNHFTSCCCSQFLFLCPHSRRNLRPIWMPPGQMIRGSIGKRGANRDNPELAGLHRFLDQLAWFLINDFGSCCSRMACIDTARALNTNASHGGCFPRLRIFFQIPTRHLRYQPERAVHLCTTQAVLLRSTFLGKIVGNKVSL